jgi:hypothetical protein
LATDGTFLLAMFWLNVDAEANALAIVVAAAVLQLAMFWLNADADWNAQCHSWCE